MASEVKACTAYKAVLTCDMTALSGTSAVSAPSPIVFASHGDILQ
jgi:hypothetical protein